MKKKFRISLLPQIIIAVALGIALSGFLPAPLVRIFATFNSIFSSFLGFSIPLIILGLVAPGIAELGKGAGKLLGLTALLAYLSTLIAGFFSYFVSDTFYPEILVRDPALQHSAEVAIHKVVPYFSVAMPPIMDVTSALILAFVLGLGLTAIKTDNFKNVLVEFKELIVNLISKAIVPLLPVYIFGVFLIMGAEGQVASLLQLFVKVISVIFVMHIILLVFQFSVAGLIAKKNPLKALWTMMPAYMTALGTQSSAATIPVTLMQTKKNGVREEIANFTVPLCATIHLAGSILKITACAYAILWMMDMDVSLERFAGFIFMVGITMVAAPGVPGGAIMAALGVLSSMLGFDENMQGLIIAIYISIDSFGTACNVTGDGAIALIINKIKS